MHRNISKLDQDCSNQESSSSPALTKGSLTVAEAEGIGEARGSCDFVLPSSRFHWAALEFRTSRGQQIVLPKAYSLLIFRFGAEWDRNKGC